MQAHFAVSAWFLFIGEGEAAGNVCHCRMVHIRIACSSCRRPECGKVTIYLLNDKGNVEFLFEGGGRGNVKQRVVIEARWITNAAITAILQYCNNCNKHYSV